MSVAVRTGIFTFFEEEDADTHLIFLGGRNSNLASAILESCHRSVELGRLEQLREMRGFQSRFNSELSDRCNE